MNFPDLIELKKSASISLRSPLTIEELYALMEERWSTASFGDFRQKNFLMFKSIELDDFLLLRFEVQITGVIAPGQSEKSGKDMSVYVNALEAPYPNPNREQRAKVKELGGFKAARQPSLEYYRALCEAMREVLSDRIL